MSLKNISDYHTHNYRCKHAEGDLVDYIKAAIKIGLAEIGFCDHFPYEFLKDLGNIPYKDYSMTLNEIPSYLALAEDLREKYKNQIEVKVGFELEFMEGQESAINQILDKYIDKIDFLFGSVHLLKGEKGTWCFDDNRYVNEYNLYGADVVYPQYFQKLEKMITSTNFDFDVVSHFDLPKKFNKFPENQDSITETIYNLLEIIKKRNIVIEINTGGLRKDVEEQYPSWNIIERMNELSIPIVLGSDAHMPQEVGYKFDEILNKLKEIGYNELVSFNKRKKEFVDI